MLPKRIEDIAVIQKHLYRPGKSLPNHIVYSLFRIERYQSFEIGDEGSTFAGCHQLKLSFVRIGSIERDPEEYETRVIIPAAGISTPDPTDRAGSALIPGSASWHHTMPGEGGIHRISSSRHVDPRPRGLLTSRVRQLPQKLRVCVNIMSSESS